MISAYTPEDHAQDLSQWLQARGMDCDDTPAIGFVAYTRHSPAAMAFLRKVEGGYAILDGFVSNPECSPSERNDALDRVTQALTDEADRLGIKMLMAWSKDVNTLTRSLNHGFTALNDLTLICRRR